MKKFLKIALVILLFSITTNVKAFSTTLSGDRQINENATFTITVGVNDASNLWGFRAPINYDSSKLTLVSSTGLNGFGVAVGSSFVADNSSGVNGSKSVATLTFKATSNFKVNESTTISLGSAEGSDGESTITGSGSSITISIAAPKNSNNNLASLNIAGYNIDFSKDKTSYQLTVEYDVTSIAISASAEDSKANISGIGTKELNLYSNAFNIVVTAENGSRKTYTIEVIRKDIDGNIKELATDNTLSSITIADYNINFNPEIMEYTILLTDAVMPEINAIANDSNATVTINNSESIKTGNNIIEISVIAENGAEQIYKINAIYLDEVEETAAPDTEVKEELNIWLVIAIIEIILILGIITTVLILIKKGKIIFKK